MSESVEGFCYANMYRQSKQITLIRKIDRHVLLIANDLGDTIHKWKKNNYSHRSEIFVRCLVFYFVNRSIKDEYNDEYGSE